MTRLTIAQRVTLLAGREQPIIRVVGLLYESSNWGRPKHLAHSRTVDSLVRRGYLHHDPSGWCQYVISKEGSDRVARMRTREMDEVS